MKFKNKLSNAQGLGIINTMKTINGINGVKAAFPTSFESLNKQFNKHLIKEVEFGQQVKHNQSFTIVNYKYHLDVVFFPTLQLKHTKASSFDIIEVIGEAFLNVDSKYF